MAHFKTSHFEVLATVVNRMSAKTANHTRVLNDVVDQLVIEFANDNPRFNETLFRAQCGSFISKQNIFNKVVNK